MDIFKKEESYKGYCDKCKMPLGDTVGTVMGPDPKDDTEDFFYQLCQRCTNLFNAAFAQCAQKFLSNEEEDASQHRRQQDQGDGDQMVAWNSRVEKKYSNHDMENIKIEATQVPDSFIIALFGKQKCDFSTAHKEKISEALNLLPPRHRYVITKRFGFFGLEAQDLMKVAKEFSVTRERIRQLEFRTLDKMRHSLGIQIDV